MQALPQAPQTVRRCWPDLRVATYLLPPLDGCEATQPDSIEVIFSAHRDVAVEFGRRLATIALAPGTTLVRGAEPISWLRVREFSDSIVMYPDMALLQKLADEANAGPIELEPLLLGQDPVMLAVAHIMRRACAAELHVSDIEATSLAHLLVRRLLLKHGVEIADGERPGSRMADRTVDMVGDFVEENLCNRITLEDMADLAQLSPFHFVRCFKATTGLPPYQYVVARRLDLAKRLLMTSTLAVAEIAWTIGFENLSHFRRQFAAHFGIMPSRLRQVVSS